MYTLHGFSQSGNTYKVALLLQALGVPWQAGHVTFEAFAQGLTRSPDWRATQNTMGEVPILDDGQRQLTQSAAIMLHLSAQHGGLFGGADDSERYEVLRWLFFDNHKFTSYFATWRFMKSFAPTAPDPAVGQWLRGRIDNAFGIVEQHLASRAFMVGAAPTLADMSLAGYLYFPADESDIDLATQYPAIGAWLARLRAQLPGWQAPYALLPGPQRPPNW